MRVPKRLHVGPFSYRVKRNHGMQELGMTDERTTTIFYSPAQSRDSLRDTMLHEVLHACLFVAGMGNRESLVRRLSPVLLQALRENPALVALLLDDSD